MFKFLKNWFKRKHKCDFNITGVTVVNGKVKMRYEKCSSCGKVRDLSYLRDRLPSLGLSKETTEKFIRNYTDET